MTRDLLYLIGEPGVGKSVLMAELVRGLRRRIRPQPFMHTVYEGGLVQLGRERADFSGTDALSMSVNPGACAMIQAKVWDRVVGEGDRLANARFFEAVQSAGYALTVVLLTAPEEVLAERRQVRGSNQDPTWLKGRKTRVQNLQPWVTKTLDATQSIDDLAGALRGHPVFVRKP